MASRHSATYSGDLGDHSCVCAATRDVHHALLYQAGHKSWSRYNALCQPPQPEPPIASIAVDTRPHTNKRRLVNEEQACLRCQANSGGVPPNKHAPLSVHHGRVCVPTRDTEMHTVGEPPSPVPW